MSAFDNFRTAVGLPPEFGSLMPYVHFYFVDDSLRVGADADVMFLDEETGALVEVIVTEWSRSSAGTERTEVCRVKFDVQTGQIINPEWDQQSDLAVLVTAMSSMKLLPTEKVA